MSAENAEGIRLGRGGERQVDRLKQRVARLAETFRRITTVNRNLGFFSTGYIGSFNSFRF